jgi:hypothetical protein
LILNSANNILLVILDRLSYNLLILPIIIIFLTTKEKLGSITKNLRTPNQSIKKKKKPIKATGTGVIDKITEGLRKLTKAISLSKAPKDIINSIIKGYV